MLTSLRHRAVSGTHHENRTIHLSRASDHVFNIVSVARAIDVRIVAIRAFVFDVRNRNRHRLGLITHRAALCDIRITDRRSHALAVLHFYNSSRQSRLTMVNVTNSSDVHMRFRPLKILFCHCYLLRSFSCVFV